MEITEKERLMLCKKKDTICGLTLKILDMAHDPQNSLEIKKKVTTILSLLNTIASYSNAKKKNLDVFTSWVDLIFSRFYLASKCGDGDQDAWDRYVVCGERRLEEFCNAVNSIRFDFTKKDLNITFPKINLNFGNIINE